MNTQLDLPHLEISVIDSVREFIKVMIEIVKIKDSNETDCN